MGGRGTRIRMGLATALAALALAAFAPAVALAASSSFTGGPDQYAADMLNDHTPVAVHFSADASGGLAANTTYYLKVRFTVGTSPSGSTNRGFTWNPATQRWVQERESWTLFPTVSTDASGAIGSSSGWVFAKFGDDTKSGQYHVLISLSPTGVSDTFNGSFVPTITVLNAHTNGSWVHNGVATGKAASKRAAISDAASTTVFALQKTEAQLVDDDSDGVVDDEDFGPAGATGDFWMGVPSLTALGVNLNQSVWAPGTGFVSGPADTDLAISAAETVAPTAPGLASGTAGDATASVAWTAATDDTAVSGYYVYRWNAAPLGSAYSPVHSRVATLSALQTTYEDSGLSNGSTYYYEVRAFDAATNVGPRSTTVTVTPAVAQANAVVSPAAPDGEGDWYVTAPTVTITADTSRTALYSFEATPSTWTTYTAPIAVPSGESTLLYRETDGFAMSATQTLNFKVDTSTPTAALSAPVLTVPTSKTRSFGVSWSGADSVSGIASYDVQYRVGASGAWVDWRSGTSDTSAVFSGSAGANYYFRARSRDVAGNVSAWTGIAQSVVPYDQTKAHFSSGWKTTGGSNYYLGSARYSTKKGKSASLSFGGGTLYLVAKTGPSMGKMAVYLGGKRVGTVNLHSSSTKYRQALKLATRAAGSSAKTVKLVNLGVSGHKRVEIDGFAFKN